MQVYSPSQNKVSALKVSNPTYWALLLTRSEYSESEIEQTLTSVDEVNENLHSFLSTAYDLLEDEYGSMDSLRGFASDAHQKLSEMLANLDYLSPSFSQNSHSNCFPVSKWQKEAAQLNNQIAKVQKFIASKLV